ncbi:hypothetical protein DFH09DRAFT_1320140 [Mycena vulgaris]|nr:hypothetical protein DFH09DRAFT_1320120 [Mycena vulgaris]KAJ6549401.1 hypothetical protein DFH09DRAFT_1320140 [Mycena vulgaris]
MLTLPSTSSRRRYVFVLCFGAGPVQILAWRTGERADVGCACECSRAPGSRKDRDSAAEGLASSYAHERSRVPPPPRPASPNFGQVLPSDVFPARRHTGGAVLYFFASPAWGALGGALSALSLARTFTPLRSWAVGRGVSLVQALPTSTSTIHFFHLAFWRASSSETHLLKFALFGNILPSLSFNDFSTLLTMQSQYSIDIISPQYEKPSYT